jgi:hypothetical protein
MQKVKLGHEIEVRTPPVVSMLWADDHGSAGLTVIVMDWVLDAPSESVASTVKVSVVAEGSAVPVMAPVEESRLRPEGREPEAMLQVMALLPPEASRVWE